MTPQRAATVDGIVVSVTEVDAREERLRATRLASSLPARGTSEGRQLRRWLTQLLVSERVVASEADKQGLSAGAAPSEDELLPDTTARMEIGSVAASLLADSLARALFVSLTAGVDVTDDDVAAYHARNPLRFATRRKWTAEPVDPPQLHDVRTEVREHLRAAARRRAFRLWLDGRLDALVELAPGYEHPGDPRQPDNTHRH
jgi:[acyl-carrier-protein] S-malonyltransferase